MRVEKEGCRSVFVEYLLEIVFGLISAGALAACRHFHKKFKNYEKLINDQKRENLDQAIEVKIEPIVEEIEELREYIRKVGVREKHDIALIISSYKYRLVQLCRQYLLQGYITQEQYDQLSEFYKVYSGLGGNGQAKTYYDRAIALPMK